MNLVIKMTLLNYLKKSAKSPTAVYTTFLQEYSKYDNSLHVFYEGKDDSSFYTNFIENQLPKRRRVFYYQAKNKNNVYQNYDKINWSAYSKKRILFFVDKDFADILKTSYPIDTNIFVTKFYSIENYLVDKHLFGRVLRDLIGIENDKKITELSNKFQAGLKTFYNSSLILTAFIIYHRQKAIPLNLQDVNISDLFKINDIFKASRKQRTLSILNKYTGSSEKLPFVEIRKTISNLRKIGNPKNYTRGKFELAFMVICVNLVPDILNKNRQKGEKKYKCCVNLSMSNAIQILGPRLRPIKEVKDFINKAIK